MRWWRLLLGPNDFMPRGYCYLWNSGLVWLHVISDSVIALSCFAIPLLLIHFVRKRRDIPFGRMFVLFGVFIVACGTTHVMEVWNLWNANYWLSGGIKAVTAAASISTVILLARLLPQAVHLPNINEWKEANEHFAQEVRYRRDLELELRTRETTYREQAELLDLCHDAIFVRSCGGDILYWNRGAERLYGWQKEEALRRVSHELLRTEFPIPRCEIEAQVLEKGFWEGELSHTRRDGAKIIVSSRWALRTDPSGKTSHLEINRDITERRSAEEHIRKLNLELRNRVTEFANINHELETFSYSVSHDLRAPLRHIDGFSRILKEDYSCELSPEAQRHLDRILRAASHMGHLVDDLLALARLGRKELVRQKVPLDSVLREAIAAFEPETANRQVDWQIQPLPEIECDPGLLKLVFSNLLSNALKFTRKQTCASIQIGTSMQGEKLAFFVRDNGVGFDPKYADKLFGVFQRLHTQEEFEGTGVGLAAAQRILHRHEGNIWAESQPGCGTTFFFTLNGTVPLPTSPQIEGKNDAT